MNESFKLRLQEAKEALEAANDTELEARLALQAAQKAYDKAASARDIKILQVMTLIDMIVNPV